MCSLGYKYLSVDVRFFFLLLSQEFVVVWDLLRVNSELSKLSLCTVATEFCRLPLRLFLCPTLVGLLLH